jgi:dihydroneopterin aldolase
MGQIALEGMEFFAFHGYYDEEQKIGNKYGVDLYIETNLQSAATSDDLHETVNYETLYNIVLDQMKIPARLLEHIGHRIIEKVQAKFPKVKSVKVKIYKFNPPLGGICHRAMVTLEETVGKSL